MNNFAFYSAMRTILILLILPATVGIAQDISYAREVIKTLCSDELKGRGYVSNGDTKAAEFIAGEFEKIGVKKYSSDYYQRFTLPVNTIPGEVNLVLNGKELKPGTDYLIDPGSPSVQGKFKTIAISPAELLTDQWIKKVNMSAGKFLVVEQYKKESLSQEQLKTITDIISFLRYGKDNPASGTIVLTDDKLTWSSSTIQYSKPSITVLSNTINTPIKAIDIKIESEFNSSYQTQNIVGFIEGRVTDTLLVLTAHYDHLGMMGNKTVFPGANDNASGVAMLLNMAKRYSSQTPRYTIAFIAFSGEESGLLGSTYFTEHPLFNLHQIKFLINFDISGTGDDGIQVVNGKIYQDKFDRMVEINREFDLLNQIKIRGEACNSDHCMFYRKGVPCFFIYTLGGIQAYHDVFDRAETLPLTEFEDYFVLMTKFIDEL